jgi:hypothetical protein
LDCTILPVDLAQIVTDHLVYCFLQMEVSDEELLRRHQLLASADAAGEAAKAGTSTPAVASGTLTKAAAAATPAGGGGTSGGKKGGAGGAAATSSSAQSRYTEAGLARRLNAWKALLLEELEELEAKVCKCRGVVNGLGPLGNLESEQQ